MPTFANILHTLAPPISSHERLHIHTTHDLSGYPTLDPLIHSVFARVMSQVEGGDLVVMHRGRITESGTPEEVFEHARDPYTRELIDRHCEVMKAFTAATRTGEHHAA